MSLLQVRNLEVTFATADGPVHAVNGVNFDVDSGEILAIVGESGSGKSQTAFAIMGLLSRRGQASGSVKFDGREILGIPEPSLAGIRATEIAIIFQNPMTSLNPFMRISEQMTEVLMQHENLSKRAALDQCIRMLDAVQIPDAHKLKKTAPAADRRLKALRPTTWSHARITGNRIRTPDRAKRHHTDRTYSGTVQNQLSFRSTP